MAHSDLLQTPSRNLVGRVLERFKWFPGITKIIRIRRMYFLRQIRGQKWKKLVERFCQNPASLAFEAAMKEWLLESTKLSPPSNLPYSRGDTASCRCSVIINTVDRAEDLEQTLEALSHVWDDSQDELIIVLGPATDRSEEVIHRARISCRLIHCPERNLSISRNIGWKAARGHYLAFIDDDASPAKNWLDALLQPLQRNPKVGISAGFIMDGKGTRFLNRYIVADTLGRAYEFQDQAASEAKIKELGSDRAFLTATGCNMAFKRSALDAVGGFDPFYTYFLEETDLVFRLISAGFECAVAPESIVFHRLSANVVRNQSMDLKNRIVVIRSQIHYIEKFGKIAFSTPEIRSCLWQRVLLDLEKISRENSSNNTCGDLQKEYLRRVSKMLGMCSNQPKS